MSTDGEENEFILIKDMNDPRLARHLNRPGELFQIQYSTRMQDLERLAAGGLLNLLAEGPTERHQAPYLLRLLASLLSQEERAGWLEEHTSSLAELPNRRARWAWTWSAVLGFPHFAYTLRTGGPKEPA